MNHYYKYYNSLCKYLNTIADGHMRNERIRLLDTVIDVKV